VSAKYDPVVANTLIAGILPITNLLLNGFQQVVRWEMPGQQDNFSEPRRNRETNLRRELDLDVRVRYHPTMRPPDERMR
jgi:hypothetical protein